MARDDETASRPRGAAPTASSEEGVILFRSSARKWIGLAVGPLLAVGVYLFIPPLTGSSPQRDELRRL